MRTRLVAVALCVAVLPGCTSVAPELCDALCDCEECTEAQYDQCFHGIDVLQARSDDAECADEGDAWLECMDAAASCQGGQFATDGCEPQYEELATCLGETPCCPTFDACGRATKKLALCGVASNGSSSSSYCTETIRCVADCINVATCADITADLDGHTSGFSLCFAACG